jgi:hypothetical protein
VVDEPQPQAATLGEVQQLLPTAGRQPVGPQHEQVGDLLGLHPDGGQLPASTDGVFAPDRVKALAQGH